MKTQRIVCFLIFFLLGTNCSRIGFYEEGPGGRSLQTASSHTVDSSSCDPDSSLDSCPNPQDNNATPSFFRTQREETSPGYLTEYFEIPNRHDLEIVFVLDVSRSMNKNLKKTGQNLIALLSHIQHKRWRMAFTTADHGDHKPIKVFSSGNKVYPQEKWEDYQGPFPYFGKFMPLEWRGKSLHQWILQYDTPKFGQIFKDTLTRENPNHCHRAPYCQGPNEQPLRSLQSTFLRYRTDHSHQQFFKSHTDTVAIIITDEDERRQDPQNATKAQEVKDSFKAVFKGQRKRLFAFSISVQDEECYRKEGYGAYGRAVGRLADITLGKDIMTSQRTRTGNISLCSKDYGQALSNISRITRAVTESITLEKMFYIPETVDIQLTPEQPQVSWRFYGRKLVFSDSILPKTKIRVSYQYETSAPMR